MGDPRVAALLAGRVFGRIDWLGLPSRELAERSLLIALPDRHFELAKALRQLAGPLGSSANLPHDIHALLTECAYRPVAVVQQAVAEPRTELAYLFPYGVLGSAAPPRAAPPAQTIELADPHLHSGASMELSTLIGLAVRSRTRPAVELAQVKAFDHGLSRPFSVGVLLAGVRAFVSWIHDVRSGRLPAAEGSVLNALADQTFWAQVRELSFSYVAATTQEATVAPAGISWDELTAAPLLDHDAPDPVIVIRDFVTDCANGAPSPDVALCEGLLGALFLLNSFLHPVPGEGLPSFVDRFDQVGDLRDAAVERTASIRAAIDRMMRSDRVAGAEFRKSVYMGLTEGAGAARSSIVHGLAAHLDGFAAAEAVARRPRNLSMPVAFLRLEDRLDPLSGSGSVRQVHALKPVWTLAAELIDLRGHEETVERYVRSVDVVGNELAMPNWPFVPVLDELQRSGLVTTCHAGESFLWPLQGVRSVGELLMPSSVVDRIGHGLALDEMTRDSIVGNRDPVFDARTVVDDVCWVVAAGLDDDEGSARTILDRVLAELGLDRWVPADAMVEAWVARRTLAGFATYGLGGRSLNDAPRTYLEPTAWETSAPHYLAFLLLVYRGEKGMFPFDRLDHNLSRTLAARYDCVNESLAARCTEKLLAFLKRGSEGSDVVIEACPTSNMRLSKLSRTRHLPLRRWCQEAELNVSLNSDDPLLFGALIEHEAELVVKAFDEDVLRRMAATSVRTCGSDLGPVDAATWQLHSRQFRSRVEVLEPTVVVVHDP